MRTFIFGYGSLINSASISKTIKRIVDASDLIPVKLHGFKRIWNLKEKVFSQQIDASINAIFLNIEEDKNSYANGIIFEVTDEEFKYLKTRERNYECLNVQSLLQYYTSIDKINFDVFVFIASDPRLLEVGIENNCFIMKRYIELVENGCKSIGDDFYKDYIMTTQDPPFSILEGEYTFI